MSKLPLYNQDHKQVGEIELDDSVFGVEVREHLLHLAVRKQLAARRQGTHAVKRRSEVSGGGKKPFKQKGTGRARQGSTRSPQFRGGGVVFGPSPRSYDFKVNKKELAAALRSALTRRVEQGALIVVDDLAFAEPKTKQFVEFMGKFELGDALVVLADANDNVVLASRNLSKVTLLPPGGVNVYDVLRRSKLVMSRAAVAAVTVRLGGEG